MIVAVCHWSHRYFLFYFGLPLGIQERIFTLTSNGTFLIQKPNLASFAFLGSDWTQDKDKCDHASNVYYPRKSIGYWLKNVDDQGAIDAYFAFRQAEHIRLAEEYLRENRVSDFVWTQ